MGERFDAVVLGADVEGLAAAATLARGGRRVALVSGATAPGGVCAREEFHPGYFAPGLVDDVACVRRELLAPLGLEGHGLAWRERRAAAWVADGSARGFLAHEDPALLGEELGAAHQDVAALERWRGFLARVSPFVSRFLDQAPPEVQAPSVGDLWHLARQGLGLRRLGGEDMLSLMRIAAMPAADWIGGWFAHPALRAALVAPALAGTVLGPRAPGTAALVLLRSCGAGASPVGGAAALAEALVSACRVHGVVLRLGDAPTAIRVGARGVEGVRLGEGSRADELEAPTVLSTLGVGSTLLGLVPRRHLPPELERCAASWRTRPSSAVLRLALGAPPSPAGRGGEPVERALVVGSLDALERAADALKYRVAAETPTLDAHVPSHADPGLAPPGHAVMSVRVRGVPGTPEGGWDDARREALVERALELLEVALPGLRECLVATELVTAPDLERRHGLEGGHPEGGELALDQLWLLRPALALARYGAGVRGLYLGGSSSHPGGPFLGGAGVLAAQRVLRA